jgi:class 3 adenylate cyclase
MVFPVTLLVHLFYIFLFAVWDVRPLAIFNIFSVILWFVALLLWRKQRLILASALGMFEVLAHATLVIIFLGWGFGGQYYTVVLLVGIVLISLFPRRVNLTLSVFIILLFIGWYYYTEFFLPLASAPPLQLTILNILNIAGSFGIVAAGSLYMVNEVEHADKLNEDLLNNVLPQSIVDRLKKNQGAISNPSQTQSEGIAESFSAVSVLFADVVGFTTLSEQLTPQDTVDLLNEVFIAFDKLAEKYGVEKIRTIGDGYMVAAGAPLPLDDHAQALAAMALEMQDYMKRREATADIPLQVRIGINSGEAVAGIVGTTKFHYDLWGDMVNTASRMESHGLPGKIQIARPTYELIKEEFYSEPRGLLEVKGKGEMEAWFVTGARFGLKEKVV